jgi:crossover junction endodeoxyribonuclease RuvC
LSTIELIDTHNPDEVAIEAPSLEKCAVDVKVGRAQGVAMAAALRETFD